VAGSATSAFKARGNAWTICLDRVWSLELSTTGVSELEFRDDWAAVHRMNSLVHLDRVPARP